MKLRLIAAILFFGGLAHADDNAFFKIGPLEMNIPFKTTRATYLYDFRNSQNLVGAETPIFTFFGKIEETVGVVTSLEGQGTPFVGGNVIIDNVLDKWITLPPEFSLGAFGGYNFRTEGPIYGLKGSYKIW